MRLTLIKAGSLVAIPVIGSSVAIALLGHFSRPDVPEEKVQSTIDSAAPTPQFTGEMEGRRPILDESQGLDWPSVQIPNPYPLASSDKHAVDPPLDTPVPKNNSTRSPSPLGGWAGLSVTQDSENTYALVENTDSSPIPAKSLPTLPDVYTKLHQTPISPSVSAAEQIETGAGRADTEQRGVPVESPTEFKIERKATLIRATVTESADTPFHNEPTSALPTVEPQLSAAPQ